MCPERSEDQPETSNERRGDAGDLTSCEAGTPAGVRGLGEGGHAASARYPGHMGVNIVRPHGTSTTYTIVLRFDSHEHLLGREESDTRQRMIACAAPQPLASGNLEIRTGLGYWLTPPSGASQAAPDCTVCDLYTEATIASADATPDSCRSAARRVQNDQLPGGRVGRIPDGLRRHSAVHAACHALDFRLSRVQGTPCVHPIHAKRHRDRRWTSVCVAPSIHNDAGTSSTLRRRISTMLIGGPLEMAPRERHATVTPETARNSEATGQSLASCLGRASSPGCQMTPIWAPAPRPMKSHPCWSRRTWSRPWSEAGEPLSRTRIL